jgi:hypothetical protein
MFERGDRVIVRSRSMGDLPGTVHSADGILAIRLDGQRALFRRCFVSDCEVVAA